jgi:curli biogenesis system outer membrane secretion channel CsgG
MKLLYTLFISLFLLSLSLNAQEGTRVVKLKQYHGYGATKTLALQNALVEAVKQKNGAYVQSVKKLFRSSSKNYASDGQNSASLTKMNSAMSQDIRVATAGFIDNYEILNMKKDTDGYDATIQVKTVEYRAPGNSAHKRRKIVIVPSYTENVAFRVLSDIKSPKNVSYNLSQELTNDITQTRKFSVLDRNNKNAYKNEKNFILSPDTQKDEILKLGQALGTDYLVVSTIKEFKITQVKKYIQSIGQEVTKLKAFATVNYQILTMATRQVKWSDTIDFEFTPKGHNEQQIFYNVLRKISKKLTNDIIENIYPIRISKVSRNGNAILTQTAPLGTIYDVYSLGDKLYDPYTKEFLGYDEIKTGTIKIVRSLAKVSYGEIIDGDVHPNSICRKVKNFKKRQSKSANTNHSSQSVSNGKKSIAIKGLSIDSSIDKYKYKYLKDANIPIKIKNLVSKSKKYRVLTRDKMQAQAMMDENEFANSDLSDSMDEDAMKFSNVDYQLLPKITKFKIYTTSKKIPDIDAYENYDYIKMELNVVVLDRKGEVIFESTQSETYSKSSSSEYKLKRKRPSYKMVSKIADKLVSKVLYDLLNKKAQMLSKKFITVVEVSGKTIYLDLGDNQDIQEGDEFPVYKEPTVKVIKRTGKTRLSYGDRIATVRIDGIYDDGAEAIVVKGNISKIKEGYVLRMKKKRH